MEYIYIIYIRNVPNIISLVQSNSIPFRLKIVQQHPIIQVIQPNEKNNDLNYSIVVSLKNKQTVIWV